MVSENQIAWIFLGYLLVPIVLLFLWWLAGWVYRKVFRKRGGEEQGVEGES